MNLRILKKLSKRAALMLPELGDGRHQFRAEKYDNYHGLVWLIIDRTCWARGRSRNADVISQGEIKKPAADGKGWVYMRPPEHPLKGTMMVGAMSGYYEPEWDEECCWAALEKMVRAHFTDWEALAAEETDGIEPSAPIMRRDLSTPSKIFAAAHDMIAEMAAERAARLARPTTLTRAAA